MWKKLKQYWPLSIIGVIFLIDWQKASGHSSVSTSQGQTTPTTNQPNEGFRKSFVDKVYPLIMANFNNDRFLSRLITAQAILESDWGRSKKAIQSNNIFGMMQPKTRKTVSQGKDAKGFAVYTNWAQCVQDYRLYADTRINGISYDFAPSSAVTFVRNLKARSYFTESEQVYQDAIRQLERQVFNLL